MNNSNLAKTPEELMRSRYAAYVAKNFDYIRDTMKPPALLLFEVRRAARVNVEWLGLEVLSSSIAAGNPNIGFVEFKARYRLNEEEQCQHEKSEFHFIDGAWYYVDGVQDPR